MTFMLTCNCPPVDSDCSLEYAVKAILEAEASYAGVQVYTGDMATAEDTGDVGPVVPYCVLSDLGANNSRTLGENLVQHQVILRLRFYTTTDKHGLTLARDAVAALRAAGTLTTVDGYACMDRVPGRARAVKLGSGRWMTQVNQSFFIHNHA